jgi:hypothetical protein
MSRSAVSLVAIVAAMTSPALAADWSGDWGPTDFRGSYTNEPKDWSGLGDTDDALGFEAGLRYWYSMGSQDFDLGGETFKTRDTAHIGEAYLRIDDHSSNTYVKAYAGYSAAITGSYDVPVGGEGDIIDGTIGYATADFGWDAFADGNGNGVGGFIGVQRWNDSPRTTRDNYAIITGPDDVAYDEDTGVWSVGGDGVERKVDITALRLGVSGQARFGDFIDVSAEVAAIPYATIGGRMGGGGNSPSFGPNAPCDVLAPATCDPTFFLTSPLAIEGSGYGAEAEAFIGFHPMENLTFRVGGRAWYLTGTYDATYSGASVYAPQVQPPVAIPDTDPVEYEDPDPRYSAPTVTSDDYIDTNNPFSMFRYGLLAELTYAF